MHPRSHRLQAGDCIRSDRVLHQSGRSISQVVTDGCKAETTWSDRIPLYRILRWEKGVAEGSRLRREVCGRRCGGLCVHSIARRCGWDAAKGRLPLGRRWLRRRWLTRRCLDGRFMRRDDADVLVDKPKPMFGLWVDQECFGLHELLFGFASKLTRVAYASREDLFGVGNGTIRVAAAAWPANGTV